MKQRTKSRIISCLTCSMVLAGSLGIGLFSFNNQTQVVNAESNTKMYLETQELVYNSTCTSKGGRTVTTDAFDNQSLNITENGATLAPGKDVPTVATVLHCPETATGTHSVVFNNNTVYRKYAGNSKLRYRLVLNDEIVYPTDGGWIEIEKAKQENPYPITATVEMSAGDDLYFVVNDSAAAYASPHVYFGYGCSIDGTWFDCTKVNHINSTADDTEISGYFGGTYTYSDLFTYEAVTSWTEYQETKESAQFDNLQQWSAGSDQTFSTGNLDGTLEKKSPYTASHRDMRGAEYYAFQIDNLSRESALDFLAVVTERDPNVGYGCEWAFAEGAEYYLQEEDKTVQIWEAQSYDNGNRGVISVPAGFKGQVLLPLENFEIYSWLTSSNSGRANRIKLYTNARVLELQQANFADLYLTTPISEPVILTNLSWLGSDLVTGWVADDYTTAIKAIDNIGTVTMASESQIVKAQSIYNKLSDTEKAKVTNYSTLETALTTFAALSDYSAIVGTDGKDFTDSEGIQLQTVKSAPSTISAWIKVGRNVEDKTHVGTVVGNMSRLEVSGQEKDANETFSMEITANGNPRFVWRKSATDKATFTVYNVDVRTGNWLNLAFVRDQVNGMLYCYVNGEMVAQKQTNAVNLADITITNNYLMVGSDYTTAQSAAGFAPDFKGGIAGVRVYTTALSATQMKDNLTSSVADAGLVSDISFRSGAGDSYYDKATATGKTSGTGAYTLTINDTYGNLVESVSMDATNEYVLPVQNRPGYVFVGYMVDNSLVPANTPISVNEDKTIVAYFVEFAMFNGASIRVSEPTGVRFGTQIDKDQLDAIKAGGATVSFGTLIAMASDITVEEALDYTMLTKGCGIKHLDVVSTVQLEVGRFVQFNGAVVGIKTTHYNKKFVGRAYMTITYSNSETQVFYASVTDNARSVAEVAELALTDTCALQTNQYKYLINGAYCWFDETGLSVLNGFIGE